MERLGQGWLWFGAPIAVLVLSHDAALRRDAATLLCSMLFDLALVAAIKVRLLLPWLLRCRSVSLMASPGVFFPRRRLCAGPARLTTWLTCWSSRWTCTPSQAVRARAVASTQACR